MLECLKTDKCLLLCVVSMLSVLMDSVPCKTLLFSVSVLSFSLSLLQRYTAKTSTILPSTVDKNNVRASFQLHSTIRDRVLPELLFRIGMQHVIAMPKLVDKISVQSFHK